MIFLDPTSDIAFKKLFGTIVHKNILISFLNSVLERSRDTQIVDVVINDPTNHPETLKLKSSIVDVRCTDQRGYQYIVEMQVLDQEDFRARAQYYSSLALSRQLDKRERYDKLVPVIFVGVLSFELFAHNRHYLSHHLILDNKTYNHELKHLEFHFIELTKFDKSLERAVTDIDKWIYFFKHAVTLDKVPQSFENPVMQEAFDVLKQGNWSKSELEAYDRYWDVMRCDESRLNTAEKKGRAEGIIEGKKQLARQLLTRGIMTSYEISQISDLGLNEIEELTKLP